MNKQTIATNSKMLMGLLLLLALRVHAADTSSGLTLLEAPGARPAALGEAFTAAQNDVAALSYNPASLSSLKTGHASFLYQKGIADDAYGQFMVGSPLKKGGWGISAGYYNGGDFELSNGATTRNVTAQKDYSFALGYGFSLNKLSIGISGKYLSSELIESVKTTAYAADLGLQMAVSPKIVLGAAIQNLGTKVTYVSEGDNLPRIARLGASFLLLPGRHATTLFLDAPYLMNEKELNLAAGLETRVGPLMIRGGYKKGGDLQQLSVGMGFDINRFTLDYSFGFADQLDSSQRVNVSMRFGGNASGKELAKAPVSETVSLSASPRHTLDGRSVAMAKPARRIYVVKKGDTLRSIAREMYGTNRNWNIIYTANQHLLNNPSDIEVGQKIVLP